MKPCWNICKASRGFDFTGYKRSSLMRRVEKQMQSVGVETYRDYMDFLEVHPEEFARLFNTILINVTAFFRDAPSWEYLAEEIIPRILASKGGRRADPPLERRLRVRPGAVLAGDRAWPRNSGSTSFANESRFTPPMWTKKR